jgi:hypothetical protein
VKFDELDEAAPGEMPAEVTARAVSKSDRTEETTVAERILGFLRRLAGA